MLVSTLRTQARHIVVASVSALMLVLLPSCDKDNDENGYGPERSSPELAQAYTNLQSGQPGQAYIEAHGYLDRGGGPYQAEALYISGRALADQGQFESGKQHLEECISLTHSKSLKGLAMYGRADCNMGMEKYALASEQYHWVEVNYKDVKAIHQDELMFKLGMASKKAGNQDWANYWFRRVNELYNTGPFAERARAEIQQTNPVTKQIVQGEQTYWLQVDTYGSQEKAEAVAADLRAKQYRDVEVVASSRSSFPVWEVRVGKFNNRNQASRAQVDAQLVGLNTSVHPMTVNPPR